MTYRYPFANATEEQKIAVWRKGTPIHGYDSAVWRHDMCGYVMKYGEHGNERSEHGWEIDHIYPASKGGNSTLENLQPLYWRNNRRKGDTTPWYCSNAAQ